MSYLTRAARIAKLSGNIRLLPASSAFIAKTHQSTNASTQEQESSQFDEATLRKKILEDALKAVPTLGFSLDAIKEGVSKSGLSPAATNGIFKNGAFDLIDYFYKKSNRELADYLEGLIEAGEITSKNKLVREALLYRLQLTQPYIQHWPEAMAVMTFNPTYAVQAIENLLRLCDEIWYQLGDKSIDFNWYTKRLTVAAIYKSTEFFMLQDKSENFTDTAKFLDNRLADLGQFYQLKTQINTVGDAVSGTVAVLRNILNIRK